MSIMSALKAMLAPHQAAEPRGFEQILESVESMNLSPAESEAIAAMYRRFKVDLAQKGAGRYDRSLGVSAQDQAALDARFDAILARNTASGLNH